MTHNDRILDELFRSRLNDFEQVPPSHVWMKIQEKQRAGKRSRRLFFYRAAGIAAAVLVAFLAGWQLQENRQNSVKKPVIVEVQKVYRKTEPAVVKEQKQTGDQHLNEKAPVKQQVRPVMQENREPVQIAVLSNQDNRNDNPQALGREEAKEWVVPVETGADKNTTGSSQGDRFAAQAGTDRIVPAKSGPDQSEATRPEPGTPGKRSDLTEREKEIVEMNRKLFASDKTSRKQGSWMVGAQISPAFSVNQTSYGEIYASNMPRQGDRQDVNLGGGVTVEYQRSSRWSIQSGLRYSKLNQGSGSGSRQETFSDSRSGFTSSYYNNKVQMQPSGQMVMNGSAGVIELNRVPSTIRLTGLMESTAGSADLLLSSENFEQRFEYLEIPLLVRYKVIDKGWNMHMLGGVSANMLVGNKVYVSGDQGESYIGKTRDMGRLSYSASVGLGMGYRLSDKIRLHVEPQMKYYLQSLNRNPDVSFKPYSIGIYTGITYGF